MANLDLASSQLLEAACNLIRNRFRKGRHEIAAALRADSGNVYTAVHIEATVGRIAVCAEAIALGFAAAEGDANVSEIVAVDPNGTVVAPCGMCRELISDYGPEARVIVPSADSLAAR